MLDIREFADLKQLQTIQDIFSDATGLAAIAVAADGKYITKGSNFTDFCMKYTRNSELGAKRCIQCDNECTGTYFCHAGLMDFSNDIIVHGEKVGAIIGGQVLPEAPDEEKFREIARELGINENAYISALNKVPVRDEKTIRAAADLLGKIVNLLCNFEYEKYTDARRRDTFNHELISINKNINSAKAHMSDLHNTATMENILAINANIEAAHAGAAGVGFAVVAGEIGELSQQSAQVYSQIEALVDGIQQSVNKIKAQG
ncbi:MAG: PocR ligand-binding domain-containing protein [Ruminiclostridium sp.]|nr:PocR ligand-binding domain-containing protein [Ruminiclostridium sp.]